MYSYNWVLDTAQIYRRFDDEQTECDLCDVLVEFFAEVELAEAVFGGWKAAPAHDQHSYS